MPTLGPSILFVAGLTLGVGAGALFPRKKEQVPVPAQSLPGNVPFPVPVERPGAGHEEKRIAVPVAGGAVTLAGGFPGMSTFSQLNVFCRVLADAQDLTSMSSAARRTWPPTTAASATPPGCVQLSRCMRADDPDRRAPDREEPVAPAAQLPRRPARPRGPGPCGRHRRPQGGPHQVPVPGGRVRPRDVPC